MMSFQLIERTVAQGTVSCDSHDVRGIRVEVRGDRRRGGRSGWGCRIMVLTSHDPA